MGGVEGLQGLADVGALDRDTRLAAGEFTKWGRDFDLNTHPLLLAVSLGQSQTPQRQQAGPGVC